MTHAYDALMDSLAALAVEAVRTPVTAVQSYWLILAAQQDSSGSCLTLGALLRQAQEATILPMPPWAQPLAHQALERLWCEGVWWETPGALALPQVGTGTDVPLSQVVCWKKASQPYIDEMHDYVCRLWPAACHLYGPQPPALTALPEVPGSLLAAARIRATKIYEQVNLTAAREFQRRRQSDAYNPSQLGIEDEPSYSPTPSDEV